MTKTVKYLIIGSGIAGISAAETIRKQDKEGSLTVLTADREPLYTRIRLPEYLAGTLEKSKLFLHAEDWYQQNLIELCLGCEVTAINPDDKEVESSTGSVRYEKLLIASGANPFVPPVPGAHLDGVHTIRTIHDVERLKAIVDRKPKLVAMGAGLLGLEMVAPIIKKGADVTVLEIFDRLLPRQLDIEGAAVLQKILESEGFKFRLGVKTSAITGQDSVCGVDFSDPQSESDSDNHLPADAVIISAGVRPETTLASGAGIAIDKGIVVNTRMETNIPGIYAAGDCAEHDGRPYGLWIAAEEQGRAAGQAMSMSSMARNNESVYTGTTVSNTLKVSGVNVLSAGIIDVENQYKSDVERGSDKYRKLVYNRTGQLIGAVLVGDLSNRGKILKEIRSGTQ